jgi:predicted nucleic acid-binding protein
MSEIAFFDTNILVYAHDIGHPGKRRVAADLLRLHLTPGKGVISTQVLQEFFVSITRQAARFPLSKAKDLVADYLRLNVVTVGPYHIVRAIDLQMRHQVSFWDALILAAAESAGASIVLSEDFSPGRIFDGIEVRNPFVAIQ